MVMLMGIIHEMLSGVDNLPNGRDPNCQQRATYSPAPCLTPSGVIPVHPLNARMKLFSF